MWHQHIRPQSVKAMKKTVVRHVKGVVSRVTLVVVAVTAVSGVVVVIFTVIYGRYYVNYIEISA